MQIEHFSLRLKRPSGDLLPALQHAMRQEGPLPLRWAITAVEGDTLVIEGARLSPCSPSSI